MKKPKYNWKNVAKVAQAVVPTEQNKNQSAGEKKNKVDEKNKNVEEKRIGARGKQAQAVGVPPVAESGEQSDGDEGVGYDRVIDPQKYDGFLDVLDRPISYCNDSSFPRPLLIIGESVENMSKQPSYEEARLSFQQLKSIILKYKENENDDDDAGKYHALYRELSVKDVTALISAVWSLADFVLRLPRDMILLVVDAWKLIEFLNELIFTKYTAITEQVCRLLVNLIGRSVEVRDAVVASGIIDSVNKYAFRTDIIDRPPIKFMLIITHLYRNMCSFTPITASVCLSVIKPLELLLTHPEKEVRINVMHCVRQLSLTREYVVAFFDCKFFASIFQLSTPGSVDETRLIYKTVELTLMQDVAIIGRILDAKFAKECCLLLKNGLCYQNVILFCKVVRDMCLSIQISAIIAESPVFGQLIDIIRNSKLTDSRTDASHALYMIFKKCGWKMLSKLSTDANLIDVGNVLKFGKLPNVMVFNMLSVLQALMIVPRAGNHIQRFDHAKKIMEENDFMEMIDNLTESGISKINDLAQSVRSLLNGEEPTPNRDRENQILRKRELRMQKLKEMKALKKKQ